MIENKQIKAYFAGLMAGDGAYMNGSGTRTDRMSFTTVSIELVNWINANIAEFTLDNPKLNNNENLGIIAQQGSYTKTFPISYSPMFKELGILCLKKDRILCNIAKSDMRHYLLGLFDADGCISHSLRKDRNRITAYISFTHPSLAILTSVQRFLQESLDICSTVTVKGQENCYVLKFSNLSGVTKFCEWLYSIPKILTYKYSKWLELQRLITEQADVNGVYPREFCHTAEYLSLVGQSKGKYMITVDGVEYPSTRIAATAYNISDKLAGQRAATGAKGFSRRPKTTEEMSEHRAYIKRKIYKLYQEWQSREE